MRELPPLFTYPLRDLPREMKRTSFTIPSSSSILSIHVTLISCRNNKKVLSELACIQDSFLTPVYNRPCQWCPSAIHQTQSPHCKPDQCHTSRGWATLINHANHQELHTPLCITLLTFSPQEEGHPLANPAPPVNLGSNHLTTLKYRTVSDYLFVLAVTT